METVVKEPIAVSVADAARMIGISRAAMYPIVMSGAIPSFCIGTRRLIPLSGLREWIDGQLAAEAR
jgi:excisionase family DNA binding protein